MFDIGFWELAVLATLGLLILGPERLPRVANQIGTWLGRARQMVRNLQREINRELAFAEEREERNKRENTVRPPVSDAAAEEKEPEPEGTPRPGPAANKDA